MRKAMTVGATVLGGAALALTIGVSALVPSPDGANFRGVHYVRNYDADTITVDIEGVHQLLGREIAVRVRGVDSPEISSKEACEKKIARAGQAYVERLLKRAGHIDLADCERDKYFRILCRVVVDDTDLSLLLLRRRYAIPYEGETKTQYPCSSAK